MLHNLFYFPQNAIYFIILAFSVQLTHVSHHVQKFKYATPNRLKANLTFSLPQASNYDPKQRTLTHLSWT